VFIREVVNTLNPSTLKKTFVKPMVRNFSNMNMDIDTPRGRSASSSTNSSRASSVHLDVSSISYHERMEIQSNKLFWDKQVKISERKLLSIICLSHGGGTAC